MSAVKLWSVAALSNLLAITILACSPVPVNLLDEVEEMGPTDSEYYKLAATYSAEHKGISMLIMVDGKIVFEDYPNGGSPQHVHELASGTKSFSGALAMAAVADGYLNLDEKVSDTIVEWRNDPRKSKVTIRQLLNLTNGLKTGGERGKVPGYSEALDAQAVYEPGVRFTYGAVPFQVFGEVMRRKLAARGQTPLEYLKQRVFEPVGLEVGRWRHGTDGNPHLPSGAALTAGNWAKYGELIRLKGYWDGKQILPSDLLEECFDGTAANPAYGLTWWLNRQVDPELRRTIPQLVLATSDLTSVPGIPGDLVYAAGAGKQRLYISRSLKLVAVRQASGIMEVLTGRSRSGFSDAEFLSLLLTGKSAGTKHE